VEAHTAKEREEVGVTRAHTYPKVALVEEEEKTDTTQQTCLAGGDRYHRVTRREVNRT
jgi:hypothetical protein